MLVFWIVLMVTKLKTDSEKNLKKEKKKNKR